MNELTKIRKALSALRKFNQAIAGQKLNHEAYRTISLPLAINLSKMGKFTLIQLADCMGLNTKNPDGFTTIERSAMEWAEAIVQSAHLA